ncbi:MAG: hypothetical protein SynsKO_23350 [Synoicihabitans sp.]
MKNLSRILIPLLLGSLPLSADTADTINLARSFLGSESALNAVESVIYKGTLVTKALDAEGNPILNEDGTPAQTSASIEIVFAEPYYQRIRISSPERTETTGLDDYEAWQRLENPSNPAQWRMTLLDTAQIRRLRANTWENLSFFKGIERIGGDVEDQGMVTVDGKSLHKIAFNHGYGIIFYRFFDPVTGRLVKSETDTGATIVESGENRIAGVRFPNQVVTTTTRPDGSVQTVQVDFESVEVNKDVSREMFRVPSITRQ